MRFFLRGVAETADEATVTAERIFELREGHRALASEHAGANGLALLSEMYRRPVVNVRLVAQRLDIAFQTANRLVAKFTELELLVEVTGRQRSRMFRYDPYLVLFSDPAPTSGDDGP